MPEGPPKIGRLGADEADSRIGLGGSNMLTREQAMEKYGMDDDFIQAVINNGGTVESAIAMWESDKDGIIARRDAKIAEGCDGPYIAYKTILIEGTVAPKEDTPQLERSNRVSVQTVSGNWIATYWRTHKKVKIVTVADALKMDFHVDDTLNQTAQREIFRAWVCKNADKFGIKYDPADNRQPTNAFPSKYTSDDLLQEWAKKIVINDMYDWTNKIAEEYKAIVVMANIEAESPVEVTSRNGKDVSPKYNNGNWSYATIPVTATVKVIEGENDNEGYVTMNVDLVSGQMKKPTKIGDGGYNYTSYRDELLKDIKGFLPAKEDKKEVKGKSKDDPKPSKTAPIIEKIAETVPEASKPKKERKPRTKKTPAVTPDPNKGIRKLSTKEKEKLANKDVDNSKWNRESNRD